MRTASDIEQTIDRHGDAVWRVCILYFKNSHDAQDAFQDTFLKYSLFDGTFADDDHVKAWLLRVATNVCKDVLKAAARSCIPLDETEAALNRISADGYAQPGSAHSEVIAAMQALTDPPRTPVYLSLYEGYTAPEISEMLDAPVNTVYSWIARGKKLLKEALV